MRISCKIALRGVPAPKRIYWLSYDLILTHLSKMDDFRYIGYRLLGFARLCKPLS